MGYIFIVGTTHLSDCNPWDDVTDKFHCNVKSRFYVRPKGNALCFAVCHYAGRVVYQAEGFLEKNRNFLPPEVIQVVRRSSISAVRFLFQCPITRTGNLYAVATPSPEPSSPPVRSSPVREQDQSTLTSFDSRP